MKEVIIAGGTGLIGKELTKIYLSMGYSVNILTRVSRKSYTTGLQYFKWDIDKNEIPIDVLSRADYIINLSGANVGERRWNEDFKSKIMESRIKSTRLLVDTINRKAEPGKVFLNASAIGYYGMNGNLSFREAELPGIDFMAKVSKAWEEEALKLDQTKTRLIIARTGIVFSSREGALYKMIQPVKWFAGAPLGSGKQIVSWIHLEDLCRAMIFAIENEQISGPVNLVAPNPVSNKEITKAIAKTLQRPLWLPSVPGIVLKLILGEFAESVLGSQTVSSQKLVLSGFEFKHPEIYEAIKDLIRNKK